MLEQHNAESLIIIPSTVTSLLGSHTSKVRGLKLKLTVAGGMQLRTIHHKNYAVLLKEVNAVIEEMSFNVFALLEINHT